MDLFQEDLESCRKEHEESGTKSQQALAGQGKVGTEAGAGGVTGQKPLSPSWTGKGMNKSTSHEPGGHNYKLARGR